MPSSWLKMSTVDTNTSHTAWHFLLLEDTIWEIRTGRNSPERTQHFKTFFFLVWASDAPYGQAKNGKLHRLLPASQFAQNHPWKAFSAPEQIPLLCTDTIELLHARQVEKMRDMTVWRGQTSRLLLSSVGHCFVSRYCNALLAEASTFRSFCPLSFSLAFLAL